MQDFIIDLLACAVQACIWLQRDGFPVACAANLLAQHWRTIEDPEFEHFGLFPLSVVGSTLAVEILLVVNLI